MDAARKMSSSNTLLEKGTNPPQDSSPLRKGTKRQRSLDFEDDGLQHDALHLVQPSGIDMSSAQGYNVFDGFPDSNLQETCQGTLVLLFWH